MKNLTEMLQQARDMQARMTEMQKRFEEIEVEGTSGAGAVTIVLSGDRSVRRLKIDPSILGDAGVVEDLVVAAHNDARAKLEDRLQDETQKIMGGLPIPPGMKLPF